MCGLRFTWDPERGPASISEVPWLDPGLARLAELALPGLLDRAGGAETPRGRGVLGSHQRVGETDPVAEKILPECRGQKHERHDALVVASQA
jgi:hypothetical protein